MLSPNNLSDAEDDLLPNDANDFDRMIQNQDRDSDGGGFGSDEAEEDSGAKDDDDVDDAKKRRIDPNAVKKRVRNPQLKLNPERLNGPRGTQTIEKYFQGFKYLGKGHERNDLNRIMKRLEHWSHRLFPKYQFDDFLEKVEKLGAKKEVQTHLKKIRLGMIEADDGSVGNDECGDDEDEKMEDLAPIDEFDALLAEQIEKQKHFANLQGPSTSGVNTSFNVNTSMKQSPDVSVGKTLVTVTTGSASKSNVEITAEMKERMEANRQLAIQKRLARIQAMEEEAKRKAQEEQGATIEPESEDLSVQVNDVRNTKPQEVNDLDLEETMDEVVREKYRRNKQ